MPGARSRTGGSPMHFDFISGLFVLMLATFLGLEVIRRVSRLLHTPLMSLTNAISAIAVVGAIIDRRRAADHPQHGARHHRRRRLDDQHRQRLPDHRPHAQDVQEAGAAAESMIEPSDPGRVYLAARRSAVHLLAEVDERPEDRPPRRARRRRRRCCSPSSARCSTTRSRATSGSSWPSSLGTIVGVPLSR